MINKLIEEIKKHQDISEEAVRSWLTVKEISEFDITDTVLPLMAADFLKENSAKALSTGKGFKPVKQNKSQVQTQNKGEQMSQNTAQNQPQAQSGNTQGLNAAQGSIENLLNGVANNFETMAVQYVMGRMQQFFVGGGFDQQVCEQLTPVLKQIEMQVEEGAARLQNSLQLGYSPTPVGQLQGTTVDVEAK